MTINETVFFGPWIGEFGWEFMHWHSWVRKVSRREFSGYRKVVSSFPGREPFYPEADEFLPHPQWLLDALGSPRDYITDYWRGGLPNGNVLRRTKRWGILPTLAHQIVEPVEQPHDVEPLVSSLLEEYRRALPDNTRFFVPFLVNYYELDDMTFGYSVSTDKHNRTSFKDLRIPFHLQEFEHLHPTRKGMDALDDLVLNDDQLICIFPRNRRIRRPDKNWNRDRYLELFGLLRKRFPSARIALLGAPGEAHFDDGAPDGCLDLINVPIDIRMDVQLAALKRSIGAIGSLSGAMLVALAAGSPSVTWSWVRHERRYYDENLMGTPTAFIPHQDPKPELVADVFARLNAGDSPYRYRRFLAKQYGAARNFAAKSLRRKTLGGSNKES